MTAEPNGKAKTTSNKLLVDDTFGNKLQKADEAMESLDKIATSQEVPQLGSINTVSKVMNNFSLGTKLDVSEKAVRSKERQEKLSLDRLNPTTKKNIFSQRLNNRSNTEIVSKMPLQLKSIVAASAGSAKVKNNWSQLSKDPFIDYRTSNSFIFNYLQLQTVEMLAGYQLTEEAEGVLIKQPVFETATLDKMRQFGSREILCRMKRFEDQDMPSVDTGEGLDLPLFDNYFIVQNEQIEELVIAESISDSVSTSGTSFDSAGNEVQAREETEFELQVQNDLTNFLQVRG